MGEQTIDLEGLARHRGSSFGRVAMALPQPSEAEFHTLIAEALDAVDPARPVWLEDEGPHIGSLWLPREIVAAIATARTVELVCPLEERVERIASTYGGAAPAEFITTSRYDFLNEGRQADLGYYPIALLDGAIELHFMHEPDETTAWAKWERRRAKMNFDNLYIKFSQDPECCTDAMLEEFDRLDYPYKVCFTYRDYPEFRSTILVPDYFVPGAPMYFVSRTYFDAIAWLDKAHGPDTQAYRRAVATPTAKLPV